MERLEAGELDMVICMTGAGLVFLRDQVAPHISAARLGAALNRATIVSRGPKPLHLAEKTLQPLENPLGPKSVTYVLGTFCYLLSPGRTM